MLKIFKNKPLIAFLFLLIVTTLVSISVISGSPKPPPPLPPSPSPSLVTTKPPVATAIPTKKPESTKSATTTYPIPKKQSYTIAAFGDSMVETMGENLDYLQSSLKKNYPKTDFRLYNYGIGSQNIVEGLARFHDPFNYKTRNYPPIDKINADIIIISSFAYNPLTPYDKNRHYQTLMNLVKEAQKTNSNVYLLAEIAPLKNGFGTGPGGVNWSLEKVNEHLPHIFELLDNTVSLSQNMEVPLINAYSKSKIDSKYGNPAYVSTHDHIHPSIEGEVFMAEIINSAIKLP